VNEITTARKHGPFSEDDKVHENLLRRTLARRGYRLQRARRRDPHAIDYGRYSLVELATGDLALDNLTFPQVVDIVANPHQIAALVEAGQRRRRRRDGRVLALVRR
jgi:hypothetical protein